MEKLGKKLAAVLMAIAMTASMACCASAQTLADSFANALPDKVKEQMDIAYKKQQSITDVANSDNLILVAHRGLGTEAPENTLPAYVLAAKKGFKYAETDIQTTKDGVWVLSHDSNLLRMTGYLGEIRDMTLEQVQSHPIMHGANVDQYPGLVTPTLDDFVRVCQENDLNPVIEIKVFGEQPYQDIIDTLNKYGMKDRAIIISFYDQPLREIRKLDPEIKEQYLSATMNQRVVLTAAELKNCGIDVEGSAMLKRPLETRLARNLGIETNAWTVDDAPLGTLLVLLSDPMYITTNTLMPKQEA